MKRFCAIVLVAATAALGSVATAPSAGAQTSPSQCLAPPPAYPPNTLPQARPGAGVLDGTMNTNNDNASFTISGLEANAEHCLVLESTPVSLGNATTNAAGTATWSRPDVLPDDFTLNTVHTLRVYRLGTLVATIPFCAARVGNTNTATVAPPGSPACATGGTTTTGGPTTTTSTGGTSTTTTGGTSTTTTGGTSTTTTGGTSTTTSGGSTSTTSGGSSTSTGGGSTSTGGGSSAGGSGSGGSGGISTGADTGTSRIPSVLGSKTATPSKGSLAYTGLDYLIGMLKVAALAIGLGSLIRYVGRRRAATLGA